MKRALLLALLLGCGKDDASGTAPVASVSPTPIPTPTTVAVAKPVAPMQTSCGTSSLNDATAGATERQLLKTIRIGDKLVDIIPEARAVLLQSLISKLSGDTLEKTNCKTYDAYTYVYSPSGKTWAWSYRFGFCDGKLLQIFYCPPSGADAEVTE
jgi:hypothetical protein